MLVLLLGHLFLVSLPFFSIAQEPEPLAEWGCPWFPYVDDSLFLTQIIDFRFNHVVETYDTNGDNEFDVQHIYMIEGLSTEGRVIVHDTPTYVFFDFNNDTVPDIKLRDDVGNGACKDFKPMEMMSAGEKEKEV